MAVKLTDEEKVARLLEKAHAKMNDEGKHWVKGAYWDRQKGHRRNSFCFVGGIREVTGGQDNRSDMAEELRERIYGAIVTTNPSIESREDDDTLEGKIIGFNDEEKTKWVNVSAAIKRTVKALRSGKVKINV